MKPTIALTVAASVVLTILVAASSASATVLCTAQGTGSPTGTTCPAGAGDSIITIYGELAPNTGPAKITNAFDTVECNESVIAALTWNEGSATETVSADEEVLYFGKCDCEVKGIQPGIMEFHWISGTHNATITSSEAEITVGCLTVFGNVHCIYKTNATDLGLLTGGNSATADVSSADIPRLSTNPLCDEKARWDATYKISKPQALFVTGHT